MANNTSACSECDSELGLPVGDKGAKGAPSILSISHTIGGSPFTASTTSYVEAGRFIFSSTYATPFTAFWANVWVSAGTGSLRIIDLSTSTVIYEKTNITSTSAVNVEAITGQSIYITSLSIIAVQVKHNTASGATTNIGCTTFYYT